MAVATKKTTKETKKNCSKKRQKLNLQKSVVVKKNVTKKVESKPIKKDEKVVVSKANETKSVYHIMFNAETKVWSIKKDKAKRIIASYKTKEEAVARAKKLADSNDVTIMIYKKDGKVQVLTNL